MAPETFIAFLTIVSLLAVAALGVFVFLTRKRTDGRIDALNSFLDSLDERVSHKFTIFDRKGEELRTHLVSLEEKLNQERTDREAGASDLFKKVDALLEAAGEQTKKSDSILEALASFKAETASVTETLRSEGQVAGEQLREEIRNSREQVDESLRELIERDKQRQAEIEGNRAHVREARINSTLHLAHARMAEHRAAKAAEMLEALLVEDPKHREVLLLAVRANIQQRVYDKARQLVEQALAAFPSDSDFLAESARLYRIEGNRNERARVLAEGLVREPDHPQLRFERSLLHIETFKFELALEDLKTVLEQGVETPEVRYNLGLVHISMGNIPAAVMELRRSLALDPSSADSNHALGLALMQGERYSEAADFLERARERLPNTLSIRLDLATAYRLSGSPEAALRECAVARHLNPNNPRSGLEEALAYHSLAQFNEALMCLDTLLAAHPNYIRARRLKAGILSEVERFEDAVGEWNVIVESNPNDPYLRAALGEALKKAGRPSAALGCLEMAARMSPDSTSIQLSFAKEALSQQQFELVQEVVDQAFPNAANPQSRLQLLEFRFLLALKLERWTQLIPLAEELRQVLDESPEVIPLDKEIELDDDILLDLGFPKEASKVYTGLMELYEGVLVFSDFDEIITRFMRSLLPPRSVPASEPSGGDGREGLAGPAESVLPSEGIALVESVMDRGLIPEPEMPVGGLLFERDFLEAPIETVSPAPESEVSHTPEEVSDLAGEAHEGPEPLETMPPPESGAPKAPTPHKKKRKGKGQKGP
jgi:tetratricopeptide (TPR) repeat protein